MGGPDGSQSYRSNSEGLFATLSPRAQRELQEHQEERLKMISKIQDQSMRRKQEEEERLERLQQKKEALLAKRESNQKERDRISKEEEEQSRLENNEQLKKVIKQLRHAFERLDTKKDDKVDVDELTECLEKLGMKQSKKQMSEMLWEANSDVQMSMSWKAFQEMYLRCINDKTGLEPKKFFHMVEFLMHDASDKGVLTMDDCMKVLLRRYGKVEDQNLTILFGKGPVDMLSTVTLDGFLRNINKLTLHPVKKASITYPPVKGASPRK